MTTVRWFARHALLPSGYARDVVIETVGDRFTRVEAHQQPDGATMLPGVVLPGFANNHSHAFHRALRGRTHDGGGTFWTWRERMYDVAAKLDPDSYLALARATYAEMALAGVTAVGEFHYLHHAPGGVHYDDPNAMGHALIEAAAEAGVRITLLDTCYLAGGLGPHWHIPLNEVQRRFCDNTAAEWAYRVDELRPTENSLVGAAIHSVRAVPKDEMARVVFAARGKPLHVHVSEQRAENDACQSVYGCSPVELLDSVGALGELTTAVHATHLSASDIATIGRTRTTSCFCPTTERDLGDGIGPALDLWLAGSPLSLGSDQHAVIDLLEEARCLEGHERLESQERGRFTQSQLLEALANHSAIGWTDAGRLEAGARADLVAVRLDSVRTAGADPAQIVSCATAADVDTVIAGGRTIVTGGQHVLGDVSALLAKAIDPLWDDA